MDYYLFHSYNYGQKHPLDTYKVYTQVVKTQDLL